MVRRLILSIALAMGLATGIAGAQSPPRDPAQREAELRKVQEAALRAQIGGPSEIKLADQAVLRLPRGYSFIPGPEARAWLQMLGNKPGDATLGLVLAGEGRPDDWFVVVRFVPAGYVRDDDAKDWDADQLLRDLREGTEAANAERRQVGVREIEVVGWIERPRYDAATHRLVWAAEARDKGVADDSPGVNYNTYALGRDGYVSLNLVTDLKVIAARKPLANELLDGLEYVAGKRYADFNSSTDRVAEYGLAGLVAGVAAKKLGLFAVAAGLFLKFWKVLAVGAVVLATPFAKLFRRKPPTA